MVLSKEETALLLACPLLHGGDGTLAEQVVQSAQVEECSAGAVVYSPRHFRRSLGVLLSGRLQVTKGTLTVSYLVPGDLFGAAALYSDETEFATTITAQRDSRCLLLEQAVLDGLLAQSSLVRANYLRYLTGRIRFLSGRLQSLAQPGAEGKLARYLLASAQDGRLTCPATDLAKRLGLSRASLYRAFGALEENGLIARQGKTILVNDPAGLEGVL